MKTNTIITPYEDINNICAMLSKSLERILSNQLLGIYLTGSLTYGDFDKNSSDIDFLIVLHHPVTIDTQLHIKNMHAQIAKTHPTWAKRIEASYITKNMLLCEKPPKTPRCYVNDGKFYHNAPYGNEWLINLYALRECAIALVGIDPKRLIADPISMKAIQNASKQDFFQEWEPLLRDPSPLNDSHFQAYAIFTLCRILHRSRNDNMVSKKGAALWVNVICGERWKDLIKKAEDWHHGQEINEVGEILKFIKFISKVLQG